MDRQNDSEPTEVFAGSMVEVGMVKSILENSGIQAYLKDEMMGTLSPWYTSPGGAGSVKIVVSHLDYKTARIIVDDYLRNVRR
jgi:hypothetical protein